MRERDLARDVPVVGPEYGGSPDSGVVSSVGEHAPAAGDVVDVLTAERRKLLGVFDEVLGLVQADDRRSLAVRWGGIVREVLEHEVAREQVVLPAVQDLADAGLLDDVRRRQRALRDRISGHDQFTLEGLDPQEVADAVAVTSDHLAEVDGALLPLLELLPPDERMRLGEDLRQVKG